MRQQPTKRYKMIELRRHDRDLGIDKDKGAEHGKKGRNVFFIGQKN